MRFLARGRRQQWRLDLREAGGIEVCSDRLDHGPAPGQASATGCRLHPGPVPGSTLRLAEARRQHLDCLRGQDSRTLGACQGDQVTYPQAPALGSGQREGHLSHAGAQGAPR